MADTKVWTEGSIDFSCVMGLITLWMALSVITGYTATRSTPEGSSLPLTGPEIVRRHGTGEIDIEPFDPRLATTNSYDMRLGPTLLRYKSAILDPRRPNPTEEVEIPEEGLVIKAGSFWLGSSMERIGSDTLVPIIHAKSGIARLGLFVHCTADLIDVGSHGVPTFQIHALQDCRLFAGMPFGQVSFWETVGEIELYRGKYADSKGPRASESYRDADWHGTMAPPAVAARDWGIA